ncbi:MAG: RNA-binding S4 domain-containing protein [Alphaproteobacteria bacterium]|nr:RNA-binding S4 domain-containing protein [Alphaproteobacteria bacterium]
MAEDALRLDKWLWFARFCKSRSLATKLCRAGHVRLNRQAVEKSHALVRKGDVLTFAQGDRVRVIEVLELGTRRGPAAEAQALYADRAPKPPPLDPVAQALLRRPAEREAGSGRPTKRDRRRIDRLSDVGD